MYTMSEESEEVVERVSGPRSARRIAFSSMAVSSMSEKSERESESPGAAVIYPPPVLFRWRNDASSESDCAEEGFSLLSGRYPRYASHSAT